MIDQVQRAIVHSRRHLKELLGTDVIPEAPSRDFEIEEVFRNLARGYASQGSHGSYFETVQMLRTLPERAELLSVAEAAFRSRQFEAAFGLCRLAGASPDPSILRSCGDELLSGGFSDEALLLYALAAQVAAPRPD